MQATTAGGRKSVVSRIFRTLHLVDAGSGALQFEFVQGPDVHMASCQPLGPRDVTQLGGCGV